MNKHLLATTLAGLASITAAQADEGPATAPVVTVVTETTETSFISGTLSAGWESDYVFRGVGYGHQAPWAGLDLNFALTDQLTLNIGAWYINPTSGPGQNFDELDLYAFLGCQITEDLTVSVGGTWYFYPEPSIADYPEVGVKIAYSPGDFLNLGFLWMYDTNVTANYFELSAGKSFDITDSLSSGIVVGISAAQGGGNGYYGVNGGNSIHVKGTLTYALTDTFSITGYVGGDIPFDSLDDTGAPEIFHGGVSVSVSF